MTDELFDIHGAVVAARYALKLENPQGTIRELSIADRYLAEAIKAIRFYVDNNNKRPVDSTEPSDFLEGLNSGTDA